MNRLTKILRISFFVSSVLMFITISFAQETCEAIVQQAIETASENCDGLRRNQACYGNVTIDAEAAPDVDDFTFSSAGDFANVSDMASMRLSSDLGNGDWGISMMQLRASLTDDIAENVTVILFGNVATENTVTSETLEVITNSRTRIRRTPDSTTDLNIIDAIESGTTMTAFGRSQSGDWLRVRANGVIAWVGAITVDGDSERMALPIVDFSAPFMGPMQSFYLNNSDTSISDCTDIPPDGIIIQTPEGAGTIDFMVNEVRVSLSSTAFIEIVDNTLTVALLEGLSTVQAENEQAFVPAGTQTTIELAPDGRSAIAPPTDVTYYDETRLQTLSALIDGLTADPIVVQPVDDSVEVETYVETARGDITPRSGQWLFTLDTILTVEDTLITSSHGVSACTINSQVGFSFVQEVIYDADAQTFRGRPMIAPGIFGDSNAQHALALAPNNEIEANEGASTYTINSSTSFTIHDTVRNNWRGGDNGQYKSVCIRYFSGTYVGE